MSNITLAGIDDETIVVYGQDSDGDIEFQAGNGSFAFFLPPDSQRALRDFLNDALGDAGGDDVAVAVEGLTDAIYDLATAVRAPAPAVEAERSLSEADIKVVVDQVIKYAKFFTK